MLCNKTNYEVAITEVGGSWHQNRPINQRNKKKKIAQRMTHKYTVICIFVYVYVYVYVNITHLV